MVLKYKDIHAFDYYKKKKIIYNIYRTGEVSVHRACCERATQPYSPGVGEGTIYPGSRPAGVTARNLRMVTACSLTRSMLIKRHLPFHGMCFYMYIVFTVSQFHAWTHTAYLVFQIAYKFCLTQQFYQKAWL